MPDQRIVQRIPLGGAANLFVKHSTHAAVRNGVFAGWKSARSAHTELDLVIKHRDRNLNRVFNQLKDSLEVLETGKIPNSPRESSKPMMLTINVKNETNPLPTPPPSPPSRPCLPGTEHCPWLKPRLYGNRPLSDHSGYFEELKKERNHFPPEHAAGKLERERVVVNTISNPNTPPVKISNDIAYKYLLKLRSGLNMEEEKIERESGLNVRGIKAASNNETAVGKAYAKMLMNHKEMIRRKQSKLLMKGQHEREVKTAIKRAVEYREFMLSYRLRIANRRFKTLQRDGEHILKQPGLKHCLSALPPYIAYDFLSDTGANLSTSQGVGDGATRARSKAFKYDLKGERSSLRMVVHNRGDFVEEYVEETRFNNSVTPVKRPVILST